MPGLLFWPSSKRQEPQQVYVARTPQNQIQMDWALYECIRLIAIPKVSKRGTPIQLYRGTKNGIWGGAIVETHKTGALPYLLGLAASSPSCLAPLAVSDWPD